MKGVLLLKTLRQVHYLKKLSRGLTSKFDNHQEKEEDQVVQNGILEDEEEEDDYGEDEVTSVGSMDDDLDYTNHELTDRHHHHPTMSSLSDLKLNLSLDDNNVMSPSSLQLLRLQRLESLKQQLQLTPPKRRRSLNNSLIHSSELSSRSLEI